MRVFLLMVSCIIGPQWSAYPEQQDVIFYVCIALVVDSSRRVTTLEKTALFGELALLSDSERTATAVCQRDTLLLRLDFKDFDMFMRAGLARLMMPGIECLAPFECFRSVSKVPP
jgi:CRP-like cAMP-binding protein